MVSFSILFNKWNAISLASTLRNWMNGEFYEAVFSETEKAGIKKYTYENKDNPWYGTEGEKIRKIM